MKRVLAVWMLAGLTTGLWTGCSDDDDAETTPTVVVTTNVVNGVPVVTTNVAANPASSTNGAGVPVATTNLINGTTVVMTNWVLTLPAGDERAAPQLVAPASRSVFAADANGKAWVHFRWTALQGVDSYTHRMDHYPGGVAYRGTSGSMEFSRGIYAWWVHGNYPAGPGRVEPGPASQKFVFIVE